LFTRHPEALRSVFSLTPEYLRGDASAEQSVVNYMDYGIQLGRRFRALKAWMAFRALGRNGLESRIREHCRLASLVADRVKAQDGVTLAAPPMMAVVCFRFEPADVAVSDADALNEAVAEAVNASGLAYLTHTQLRGRGCLRVGIGNILTTERHVEQVWAAVINEARRVGALR
jgi:aromatic-L-amino-acid/L-tryptophan decarboxylase